MKKYRFKETGNIYVITGQCEFKHPERRDWIKAFIYSPVDKMEKIYVRECSEFLEKFEEINE